MSKPLKWAEILKEISEEVSAASPFIHYETMAKKGSIMHGVMVRGIDPVRREKFNRFKIVKPKSVKRSGNGRSETSRRTRPHYWFRLTDILMSKLEKDSLYHRTTSSLLI